MHYHHGTLLNHFGLEAFISFTRALSEITEKCPLLSNQWSFFNSVNDMIFLISLRMFPEIMKCIILHNECLDDFKDGGPP